MKSKYLNTEAGFTLIEAVITTAILMILLVGIWGLVSTIFKSNSEVRARVMATALANERVETVRNLPYDSIGTVGGIPNGTIPQTETRQINGTIYTIKTAVNYVDDPFDNLAPADLLNTDYKSVRVEVSWNMPLVNSRPVLMYTKAAPKGLEQPVAGGTLIIRVFDATPAPVAAATVHITDAAVSPAIDITQNTDANGLLIFPGAPACDGCYRVTVTKAGYNTDRTYGTDEVSTPLNPHATVIETDLTDISFTIDRTAILTVTTQTPAPVAEDPPLALPDLNFNISGAKIIGHNGAGNPVLKFNQDWSSGGSGTTNIEGLEWDSYTLSFDNVATGYDLAMSDPFTPPYDLIPGSHGDVVLLFEPHTANSLRVYVTDNNGVALIAVAVQLVAGTFDQTKLTGAPGQVFFSGLGALTYTLNATLDGYEPYASTVDVLQTTFAPVSLNPLP